MHERCCLCVTFPLLAAKDMCACACTCESALVCVCMYVCLVCLGGWLTSSWPKTKLLIRPEIRLALPSSPNPPISLHSCTSDAMLSRSAATAHAKSTPCHVFWMPIYWIIGLRSSMPCLGFSLRVICSASRSEWNSQTLNNRKVLGISFFLVWFILNGVL